jgi:ribonucleoside-diphosphate reductase beta chain
MALIDPIYTDDTTTDDATDVAGATTAPVGEARPTNILDPGFDLTLRPMRYPQFFDMYKDAIKNTWTVDEIDFSDDLVDLDRKLMPAEKHLVSRLVAFFATGDSIVANNLVLNLYQHINAPEARMYLSRQLYEEALHVQFYLTLLDNYIPDMAEREAAFAAVENIPSIKAKAEFCFKWMDEVQDLDAITTQDERRRFIMNLICFATCIEGLFFFAAFAYVYFLRSKGLLNGLADGTNWVFRDESCHMNFALEVVNTVRKEEPELFDDRLEADIREMLRDAVDCEHLFAADVLGEGVPGMSLKDTREYLQYVADTRLHLLGYQSEFGSKNPFSFMELQDVQGLSNFFERTVSSYQTGITGDVSFDEDF